MKGFFSSFALVAFILTYGAFQITAAPAPIESTDELEPRAALATVYYSCKNNKQAALTFDDGPYVWLYVRHLLAIFFFARRLTFGSFVVTGRISLILSRLLEARYVPISSQAWTFLDDVSLSHYFYRQHSSSTGIIVRMLRSTHRSLRP